jgi:HTH-type transcriptional regulator/antitoxin HipB
MVEARTVRDLAAIIRARRLEKGWTQAELAERVSVTRAWIIAFEQGKPGVDLSLVMRTIAALELVADVVPAPTPYAQVDLDGLLGGRSG